MKKTFLILAIAMAVTFLCSVAALAYSALPIDGATVEAVAAPTGAIAPFSFFSWEGLGTFSGVVALVVFLVQLLKLPIDKVWKIPTQYVVYVLSVVVLILAQAYVPALGGLTLQSAFLCLFNGALVALAAMSTYEVAIHGVERGNEAFVPVKVGHDDEGTPTQMET